MRTRTILFIDDEENILEMRRLIFEGLGYTVLTASSGEQALRLLSAGPLDLVLLDYVMPGMNGEETARRILGLYPTLRIVLSSGSLSIPERVTSLMTATVAKSEGVDVLIEAVRRYTNTESSRAAQG